MSRIDELIAEHCPDGVEYVQLSDLAVTVPGLTGKTKADFSDGNARFASYRNIFANPSLDLDAPDFVKVRDGERQNAVQFGDILITGSSESLDEVGMSSVVTAHPSEPIYLNSFCFIVRPNQSDILDPGFTKHLFRSESIRKQIRGTASGVTRINVSKPRFMRVTIPVPPLEVQRAIVEVLDTFSQLEAELEAELEARRRQYEFYRDELLTFREAGGVRWVPMGEFGRFIRGRRFTKNDMVPRGIPCIHYGEIYTHFGVSARETVSYLDPSLESGLRFAEPGDVVIAAVGETIPDVAKAVAWLGSTPVAIHDDSFAFRSEQDPRYISYAMQTGGFQVQKEKYVARAKVKRVGGENLGRIVIPIPPLEEQRRIVAILDSFDALVNDLSVGLPAELAARRQQYEHYRDRLLAFEELKAAA